MTGVEVTQEDRRAYLSLNMVSPQDKAAIMSGDWDAVHGMQVLAPHRHEARSAALEEAAKVADAWAAGDCDESSVTTAIHIDGDIRSLSRSGGERTTA